MNKNINTEEFKKAIIEQIQKMDFDDFDLEAVHTGYRAYQHHGKTTTYGTNIYLTIGFPYYDEFDESEKMVELIREAPEWYGFNGDDVSDYAVAPITNCTPESETV